MDKYELWCSCIQWRKRYRELTNHDEMNFCPFCASRLANCAGGKHVPKFVGGAPCPWGLIPDPDEEDCGVEVYECENCGLPPAQDLRKCVDCEKRKRAEL